MLRIEIIMRDIWVIGCGGGGQFNTKFCVATKHKHKVGNYIKNNVEKLIRIFQKFYFCDRGGEMVKIINKIIKENSINVYTDEGKILFIDAIEDSLNELSGEEIVDQFCGHGGDTEADFVSIIHIKQTNIINL
jgi:hypothetical protein